MADDDHIFDQTQEFAIPGLGLSNIDNHLSRTDTEDFLNFTQPFDFPRPFDPSELNLNLSAIGQNSSHSLINSTQSFEVESGPNFPLAEAEQQARNSTNSSSRSSFLINNTQSFDVGGAGVDIEGASVDLGGARIDIGGANVDIGGASVDIRGAGVDIGGASVTADQSRDSSPWIDYERRRPLVEEEELEKGAELQPETPFDDDQLETEFEEKEAELEANDQSEAADEILKEAELEINGDQSENAELLKEAELAGGAQSEAEEAEFNGKEAEQQENEEEEEGAENDNQSENDLGEKEAELDQEEEQEKEEGQQERSRDEEEEGDGEGDDKKSEVGELIADIFGDSDEEQQHENEEEKNEFTEEREPISENFDDDSGEINENEGDYPRKEEMEFVSDFDMMMQKRKAQNQKRRRKRRDFDFINNNDDMISDLLSQMKQAAKEDMELNSQRMPALRKRVLLPMVLKELKKADLLSAFIELGVVSVMAEWLSPLPDKSLPALEIRTEFLKILQQFPTLDHQILRSSNIGKAVMLLYKHPKETKENKHRASKLINEWARPIFNLQTDYRSLSKDERLKRDYDHMPVAKKRRLSVDAEKQQQKPAPEEKVLGPGDKGFIGRARVPRPSTKDYVIRPKWNVETEFRKSSKRAKTKLDEKIREFKTKTKGKKALHAIGVSIEGRKMST